MVSNFKFRLSQNLTKTKRTYSRSLKTLLEQQLGCFVLFVGCCQFLPVKTIFATVPAKILFSMAKTQPCPKWFLWLSY